MYARYAGISLTKTMRYAQLAIINTIVGHTEVTYTKLQLRLIIESSL